MHRLILTIIYSGLWVFGHRCLALSLQSILVSQFPSAGPGCTISAFWSALPSPLSPILLCIISSLPRQSRTIFSRHLLEEWSKPNLQQSGMVRRLHSISTAPRRIKSSSSNFLEPYELASQHAGSALNHVDSTAISDINQTTVRIENASSLVMFIRRQSARVFQLEPSHRRMTIGPS